MNESALKNAPEGVDRLVTAATEAMTDQMVERLSTTAGNSLEILDRLNDEETRDAIHCVIDQLTALHKNGGLIPLFETLHLINAIRNALTDSMVERLALFAEHMINNLANEDVATLACQAQRAMSAAVDDVGKTPAAPGGLMATVRMVSQPETQEALRFLLAFAGRLKKEAT